MTDLFISYAHEDEERITPLVKAFENQGWKVFWDQHIPTGQTWRSHIGEALDNANCVLVIWSKDSVNSKWVIEEADVGQKRNALIPIFLDEVEIPMGFRSIQTADLTEWKPEEPSSEFEVLVNDIRKLLEAIKSKGKSSSSTSTKPRLFHGFNSVSQKIKKAKWWYATILLVILGLFWVYQTYLAKGQEPELSGLVFATKVEANGLAVDPGISFPPEITAIYAVFRPGMAPPGMDVNVISPIQGKYYSNLEVTDSTNISTIGWRWYYESQIVNDFHMPVEMNKNYWLAYSDYSEGGIFRNSFEPGTYTIVILLDGNPAMSADLVIRPLSNN